MTSIQQTAPTPSTPNLNADMLPSHTRQWSDQQRQQHADYIEQREINTVNTPPQQLQPGSHVIVEYGRGRNFVTLSAYKSTRLAKQHTQISDVIGHQFYQPFELTDYKKGRLAVKQLVETVATGSDAENADEDAIDIYDPDFVPAANNSQLIDDNTSQTLTAAQLTHLKQQSKPDEVVKALAANSSTFEHKTEYSQQKYLNKKKRKYLATIVPLPLSLHTVLETLATRCQRSHSLRLDTLSLMLTHANVGACSDRILIVESGTSGALTAACAMRKNGQGFVLSLQADGNSKRQAVMRMEFNSNILDSIITAPFHIVNHVHESIQADDLYADAKAILAAGVDCLLLANRFDSCDLLQHLLQFLRPSASVVIYHTSIEPLLPVQQLLRNHYYCAHVQLAESFMREHQVLPNRTHPHVNMNALSGALLAAYVTQGTVRIATQEAETRKSQDNSKCMQS